MADSRHTLWAESHKEAEGINVPFVWELMFRAANETNLEAVSAKLFEKDLPTCTNQQMN